MTSSRAVGRCVRHRGHRDTEDTEEFRDFASTTLPTTDGRICCLAITAGAPRSARGLFVYTLSVLRDRQFVDPVRPRSRLGFDLAKPEPAVRLRRVPGQRGAPGLRAGGGQGV